MCMTTLGKTQLRRQWRRRWAPQIGRNESRAGHQMLVVRLARKPRSCWQMVKVVIGLDYNGRLFSAHRGAEPSRSACLWDWQMFDLDGLDHPAVCPRIVLRPRHGLRACSATRTRSGFSRIRPPILLRPRAVGCSRRWSCEPPNSGRLIEAPHAAQIPGPILGGKHFLCSFECGASYLRD